MHNLLEILIFTLRNFTKLPVLRYLGICNVLHIWHIRAIPTYRVYRLYDYHCGCGMFSRMRVKNLHTMCHGLFALNLDVAIGWEASGAILD